MCIAGEWGRAIARDLLPDGAVESVITLAELRADVRTLQVHTATALAIGVPVATEDTDVDVFAELGALQVICV